MIVNITTVGGVDAAYEDVIEIIYRDEEVEIVHERGTVRVPMERIDLLETWEDDVA